MCSSRRMVGGACRRRLFTQFAPAAVVEDSDGEPRAPSRSGARIREALDRIVAAARELLAGEGGYEQCLRDYFPALVAAHGGDAGAIWSIDGVHFPYVSKEASAVTGP